MDKNLKASMCKEGDNTLGERSLELHESAKRDIKGTLADALVGSDVFIGVSAPGIVNSEMVSSMASGAIVFAMANPIP